MISISSYNIRGFSAVITSAIIVIARTFIVSLIIITPVVVPLHHPDLVITFLFRAFDCSGPLVSF